MEITEAQYLNAIKTVQEYTEQVKRKSAKSLNETGITKTPKEICESHIDYFPSMSIRLLNILRWNFENTRICDITKKEFLSVRLAGNKSWTELSDIIGTNS